MTLLLDFGNTRVKAAVRNGDSLETVYCGPATLTDLKKIIQDFGVDGGMWCTVHPLEEALENWLVSKGLKPLVWDTPVPLKNGYAAPQKLGMDRLAAAVGAWYMKPAHDLLVIDAGTAITYDFVSAQGEYLGGNISPGISIRLRSLHEHTGALPLVLAQGETPVLGNDTETAIRSGVINGVRFEIDGMIREMRSKHPALLVFLTGGDAEYFDIKGKSTTFAVPDLVLRGLSGIVGFNEKQFI